MQPTIERGTNINPAQLHAHEADALKKLIRKLRWIGMDQEAETMCGRLTRISPLEVPLRGPLDTD